ncbi:hypothetical protein RFH54_04260 [Acinetobacter soli]|uniref:hypothetical protein n=1 Tax=Acinetobacter soli TaxID=487316 RepID=UPI00280D3162|nr:hypothetical protein [Acinetobacter soli]MDQ8995161.1 hypothetical protein [Acinetobacter soli]
MLKQEIVLSEQELKIVKEVQNQLGLATVEETMEHLARERIQEKLLNLAGAEVKRRQHFF